MVNIRRATGSRNPAEMTYYVQRDGVPLTGTSAAKVLNTVDSQTMALTLGYFVQLQAERKQRCVRIGSKLSDSAGQVAETRDSWRGKEEAGVGG